MREFDRIKDMVYDEIEQFGHHDKLSKDAVCIIGELVDILKDIGTVEMFEEGFDVPEDEYSLANYSRNGGYSQRRGYRGYDDGNSYRNGYVYNSGYSRRGRGGYSREDSKEHMIEKLNNLMYDAQDDNDREAIKRLIQQMESK